MIVVRYVFQAKWGKAGEAAQEMAKMFKKAQERMSMVVGSQVRTRILTDLSGSFDTVVQEMEFPSLAVWEKARAAMFASDEFQEQQMGENPFVSGRAELYTLEAEF
jgi:hypothetical protein